MELLLVMSVIAIVAFYGAHSASKNENKKNNLTTKEAYERQVNLHANIIEPCELPLSVTSQLLNNEDVYYFSFLVIKGGCADSSTRGDYWIALTNKRIIYKTKIRQNNNTNLTERNGIIPFDKISGIEIVSNSEKVGCIGDGSYHELQIGSMGQLIQIPLPTEEKGFEIRKIYTEVLEIIKPHHNSEDDK